MTVIGLRRCAAGAMAGCLGFSLLLFAGCSTRTVNTTTEVKDIVTASDESDASRRSRLRMELAIGYFGRGQMKTALDEVKQALQADPNLGEAYNLRGLIYGNLGEAGLAEDSFQRALQLGPKDADAMHNYGYFLCRQKRYPEADALFDRALAVPQYREPSRTLLVKGVCEASAGRLVESEITLQQAQQLDPGNPTIGFNLSETLFQRGEYERARFQIRRVNLNPAFTSAPTLWLAARIEQRLGNRVGAQDIGHQLDSRYPDSKEASSFRQARFDE